MKRKIAIEIICFLMIVLFFYAAVTKLINYKDFVGQIGKSPLLTHYAEGIAWAVPAVEILVSIMLAVPRLRNVGLLAAFGMMTLFTLYIATILSFSNEIPCSCGGVLSTLSWEQHLLFNFIFVLLAFIGIRLFYLDQARKSETIPF